MTLRRRSGVRMARGLAAGPRPGALRRRLASGTSALLAGTVLLGSIGSCELPKPNLPSIGAAPSRPVPAVDHRT